jgi:hypothetical protein
MVGLYEAQLIDNSSVAAPSVAILVDFGVKHDLIVLRLDLRLLIKERFLDLFKAIRSVPLSDDYAIRGAQS